MWNVNGRWPVIFQSHSTSHSRHFTADNLVSGTRPRRLLTGPRNTLRWLRDRPETFVEKPLDARAGISFRRVQVSLRICIQIVNAEKLSRLPSAITEGSQH